MPLDWVVLLLTVLMESWAMSVEMLETFMISLQLLDLQALQATLKTSRTLWLLAA